jgi:integrase
MSGTVKRARLESQSARKRLKRRRQPRWQALIEGKVHLGWQCRKGKPAGRWVLRRYLGMSTSKKSGKPIARYNIIPLGLADDAEAANGTTVLSHGQAEAKARDMVAAPNGGKIERITVRQALDLYIKHKEDLGQPVGDIRGRGAVHILPPLGDLVVAELTAEQLRRWKATMAAQPAQTRAKDGRPQFKPAAMTDDKIRARRASANRVLTMLKAALNHAFREGHVANDKEWRRVEPFEGVNVARVRYLTVAEAERLLNACGPDFRPLVRAALETGCRYSELTRMQVADFNPDAGTVAVLQSKSGKSRHVILTPEGVSFFRRHCAGRDNNETMFRGADGLPWKKSNQTDPMRAASARARLTPPVNFHALRHTWASLAVMNKVPLIVVAENLGHADTRMVEKHYGHLAPSYVAEAIRAGAPRFAGADTPSPIVPMPAGKPKRAKG